MQAYLLGSSGGFSFFVNLLMDWSMGGAGLRGLPGTRTEGETLLTHSVAGAEVLASSTTKEQEMRRCQSCGPTGQQEERQCQCPHQLTR